MSGWRRDEIEILGYNSRLDTVQAVIGSWLIDDTAEITRRRIENAAYYDRHLSAISLIRIPPRPSDMRCVYHLYTVFAADRDGLSAHCQAAGIECKIHYPIPLYRQPGLRHLGYAPGDFPVTDRHCREIISFPADQHLSRAQQDDVIETVARYYE